MNQKVLVIFDGNWADEMDVKGFQIWEKELWEKYTNNMPESKRFSVYIGSNQDMEFTGRKDYLSNITVKELTVEEAAVLEKFFKYGFGEFVEPEFHEEN